MGKERDGREDRPPVVVERTVAGALAVMILEKRIRETGELGIPSLGIILRKDDLRKKGDPPKQEDEPTSI